MNRSDINDILSEADTFVREHGFRLPPFANWTLDEWQSATDIAGLVLPQLGWDVTDFGGGDFLHSGLVLFTLRNGVHTQVNEVPNKAYAEKLLVVRQDQVTPMHCHYQKTEDIINRSGAALVIELRSGTPEGGVSGDAVSVFVDGQKRSVPSGGYVTLKPGESITLEPYCFHSFWAEGGDLLAGEVSSINDDATDNLFLDASGRFPKILEDALPTRLLVSDYQMLGDASEEKPVL